MNGTDNGMNGFPDRTNGTDNRTNDFHHRTNGFHNRTNRCPNRTYNCEIDHETGVQHNRWAVPQIMDGSFICWIFQQFFLVTLNYLKD